MTHEELACQLINPELSECTNQTGQHFGCGPKSSCVGCLTEALKEAETRGRKDERARCLEIANNYADVEGDSEHLRPNTAMRICMEIKQGEGCISPYDGAPKPEHCLYCFCLNLLMKVL